LIGVRTRERLSEAVGAWAVTLSESDLAAIDRITSPAGE
jgi:aryl-alcohol dehydrogenase-like predicted oxidoreductase